MKIFFQLLLLLALPATAWAQSAARVQPLSGEEQTIYKHVDGAGKVTYSNSPIKGGNRVVLEALTVIPSTPSGSLRMTEDQIQAAEIALQQTKALPTRAAKATGKATPQNVATVTTMPSQKAASAFALPPAPMATPIPAPTAAPITIPAQTTQTAQATQTAQTASAAPTLGMEALAQKRRTEVRRRLLQTELDNEEQMLTEARTQLATEQKQTGTIRAMRAGLAAPDASKPAVAPEARAMVERHFERVRDLQDQIAAHERNVDEFRRQLQAETVRVAKAL